MRAHHVHQLTDPNRAQPPLADDNSENRPVPAPFAACAQHYHASRRACSERAAAVHAIAMHGAPALPDGFSALPYVNPDAPKGGRLTEGVLGTFDSLNPLIVQGAAAAADPRLRRRKPVGAQLRRAVHALRPVGAHGRDRRRPRPTSPSRSIRRRIFPTACRSPPTTWCFPGSCCAITADPIIAPIIPRSPRPRFSIRAPCGSTSPTAATANCR